MLDGQHHLSTQEAGLARPDPIVNQETGAAMQLCHGMLHVATIVHACQWNFHAERTDTTDIALQYKSPPLRQYRVCCSTSFCISTYR